MILRIVEIKVNYKMDQEKLREYKVIMIGDSNVGKTSILQRFNQKDFDFDMEPTVGASFMTKIIKIHEEKMIMNIWDTAGQERYKSLLSTYSRNANVAVLVYDVTNQESFDNIDTWKQEVFKFINGKLILFLVANKYDLESTVSEDDAIRWAKANHAHFFQTSAANGRGIKELFSNVAEQLYQNKAEFEQEPDIPAFDLKRKKKQKSKGTCC